MQDDLKKSDLLSKKEIAVVAATLMGGVLASVVVFPMFGVWGAMGAAVAVAGLANYGVRKLSGYDAARRANRFSVIHR